MAENSRTTQLGAEFVGIPLDAESRTTQLGAEFVGIPLDAESRTTQLGVEFLYIPKLPSTVRHPSPIMIGF